MLSPQVAISLLSATSTWKNDLFQPVQTPIRTLLNLNLEESVKNVKNVAKGDKIATMVNCGSAREIFSHNLACGGKAINMRYLVRGNVGNSESLLPALLVTIDN